MRTIPWISLALAVFAGMMLPLQGVINARLGKVLGGGLLAAFISFTVGAAALLLVLLLSGNFSFSPRQLLNAPPALYVGGALGAVYVTLFLTMVGRIGVTNTIVAVVVGQMLLSLVLDHYGLLGLPVRPIDARRLAGAGILIVGLLLVQT